MAKLADLKDLIAKARASAPPRKEALVAKQRSGKHSAAPVTGSATSAVGAAPSVAASARRTLAASKHADADIDLATAFADVEPLRPSRRVTHAPVRPAPVPAQRIADAEDALAASKYGTEPAPQHCEVGQEHEAEQTYVRRGMPGDVLAKLRRGHWAVQSELDLHRMTTTQAHDALADFLDDARARGLRCVRVIHGKGLRSGPGGPVLKHVVDHWLRKFENVVAYASARPVDGGTGAVYVLLGK